VSTSSEQLRARSEYRRTATKWRQGSGDDSFAESGRANLLYRAADAVRRKEDSEQPRRCHLDVD
jgi:hypothetical protein